MKDFVFYCAHCRKTFSGGAENEHEMPECPMCGKATTCTGITKDLWLTYSTEERKAILDPLQNEYDERETLGIKHNGNGKFKGKKLTSTGGCLI